jgi:hypothetical protein
VIAFRDLALCPLVPGFILAPPSRHDSSAPTAGGRGPSWELTTTTFLHEEELTR